MYTRNLGKTGPQVPAIGLGCMGLSEFYGPATDQREAIRLLHEATELGVVHFDTAEMYGLGSTNESLLGGAFSDRRDQVFIATKFGPTRDPVSGAFTGIAGSREHCRRAVEGSLRTLRRAAAVHPIAAVQSEYSIFSRDIESEVIPACLEVGASLVAYSPLGRGMLSGRFKQQGLVEGDFRRNHPRFSGAAFDVNVQLVDEIESIATAHDCLSAQIALAWVLSRGEHVMTIPGTTKLENLKTNLGAYAVQLTGEERDLLDLLADRVSGQRYDERGMSTINA